MTVLQELLQRNTALVSTYQSNIENITTKIVTMLAY